MLKLEVKNLAKWFGTRKIFENIDFSLEPGRSIAIVGPNGSGKTTLLTLIMGLSFPTKGRVAFYRNGRKLDFDKYRRNLALVAPYMSLYGSLTAAENLRFLSQVNGRPAADSEIEQILQRVGLGGRGRDLVSAYSTGMQQRLKYAAALMREPSVLLVDEPGANLDESGKSMAFDLMESFRENAIVIIATNEKEEYSFADGLCQLGE
jgi:heme exporter protein A